MYYHFLARKKGAKSSNALNIFNLNAAKQQNISDFACTYSDVSPWVQVLTWTPVSPEKWSWPNNLKGKTKRCEFVPHTTTMPRCPRWSCSGTGCRGSSVGFESETRIESIWNQNEIKMKSIWNPCNHIDNIDILIYHFIWEFQTLMPMCILSLHVDLELKGFSIYR